MQGKELSRGFFFDAAKPILDRQFPQLRYSAGLLGYGSDVLGYDTPVSQDHMWGPRFYLFLRPEDIELKDAVFSCFSNMLPHTYRGYSVHFSTPNPNDNGVQYMIPAEGATVNPLIFIQTFEDYLRSQLGMTDPDRFTALDWLSFSEHRLLSLVSAQLYVDMLDIGSQLQKLQFYPEEVRSYLIASNWDIIASEQAFSKRCSQCGDTLGSLLVAARIAERLMRLCFLYEGKYAPYSKWFGTAFRHLETDCRIGDLLQTALTAAAPEDREDALAAAQLAVADIHNASRRTKPVDCRIESYFGRDIKVIFAEKLAEAEQENLIGTPLENLPLIGSISQVSNFCTLYDDPQYRERILQLYRTGN